MLGMIAGDVLSQQQAESVRNRAFQEIESSCCRPHPNPLATYFLPCDALDFLQFIVKGGG